MATYQKRGTRWRAIVRKKGHSTQSKSFTTKAQAQRWAAQVELDMENGVYTGGKASGLSLSVPELCDLHLKHMIGDGSVKRSKTLPSNNRILSEAFNGVLVADLSYNRLKQYCETRIRVDGVKPVTVKQLMMYLSSAVTTGVYEAGIPSAFKAEFQDWLKMLDRAGLTGSPQSRERRTKPEELELIFTHLEHNKALSRIRYADIIEFAIESCMRLGEICRIRWEDYDAENGVVWIRDRKHPTLKQGNHQRVPLLTGAKTVIDRQPRKGEYIFPYEARSVSSGFTRMMKGLGIEDLRFHDLRHEGISRLFEKGMQIQEVAMISGHRDWGSLRRYTNLKPEEVSKKWSH